MARAPQEVRPRRIVVAVDAVRPAQAALEAAAELAARREVELLALFLADDDLLHFAALPFACEIGFPSAARRGIDVPSMERLLRTHGEQARRRIGEVAARLGLRWSFRVSRATLTAELLETADDAELVIAALTRPVAASLELVERFRNRPSGDLLIAHSEREMAELLRELRRR